MIHDRDLVLFLQWALPRMQMRWEGYRKVRGQVKKRIRRRLADLGLASLSDYKDFLIQYPDEWDYLDACCQITISRFYRDKQLWKYLGVSVIPKIARGKKQIPSRSIQAWCIGSASGEEPYTLNLLWKLCFARKCPNTGLHIQATEINPSMIDRAVKGCYSISSLRALPENWFRAAFAESKGQYCLRSAYKTGVTFSRQDIREEMPRSTFDLIMCRNSVMTYFAIPLQTEIIGRIMGHLKPGGFLVLGQKERLPDNTVAVEGVSRCIYRYVEGSQSS